MSKKSATEFNSALLDLGALICLPRKPKCEVCPVKNLCCAKDPELLPIKRPRSETKRLIERHAFVARRNKILLQSATHRWRGMWILPQINGKRQRTNGAIYQAVFPFTNHQITLKVFRGNIRKILTQRWFTKPQLESIPIPSPHRRAIRALLN